MGGKPGICTELELLDEVDGLGIGGELDAGEDEALELLDWLSLVAQPARTRVRLVATNRIFARSESMNPLRHTNAPVLIGRLALPVGSSATRCRRGTPGEQTPV
jgi:hypothetical protein